MFIKNTDTYERYLAESEQIEDYCEDPAAQMLKRAQLGPEYREEMLGNMMMSYVKDFVYWADSPQMSERMPDGRPLGFDVDTLDDLEELCIHLSELQRSDDYSDEEEDYFSIKIISSFMSALLHYQFGFAYAYPKALKEGSSWAVGIRFPSGREFSFYAYIRRMMAQLEDLKAKGGEIDKYNGMTKDFVKVMLRVEESGDLSRLALYQDWYRGLDPAQKRIAEQFHSNERELLGQSVIKQEENADSTPMVFAYYCHDLLLDMFDGSMIEYGQILGVEVPVRQFRFLHWDALDELIAIKNRKMIAEGMLTSSPRSQWQRGEELRRRLSGLLCASISISAPFEFTYMYPKNQFNVWVLPFKIQASWQAARYEKGMLSDEEIFSPAINRSLLMALNAGESNSTPNPEIKNAFNEAVRKLKRIEQRHMPGETLERLSLASTLNAELEFSQLTVETPEKIFSTQRSLCYAIKGELRGQSNTGLKLLNSAVNLCMEWVNKRFFFPFGHAENPLNTFDIKKYMEDGYPSFSFNGAFTAEVFSFPEYSKWFLRLYEPDNGVYLTDDDFIPGEPGRFAENHIALWLEGEKLMSSFSTYSLHSHRSESRYRGSCASLVDLFRRNGIALRNGGVFDARPLICQTYGDISGIAARMNQSKDEIPTVVCVYREISDTFKDLCVKKNNNAGPVMQRPWKGIGLPPNLDPMREDEQDISALEDEAWDRHIKLLQSIMLFITRCSYKIRFVLLPGNLLERFEKKSGLRISDKALTLFYGKGDEALLTLTMDDYIASPDKGIDLILDSAVDYLNSSESFNSGFSYHQALEMAAEEKSTQIAANEQWQAYFNSKVQLIEETHARELENVKKEHSKTLAQQYNEIQLLQKRLDQMIERQTELTEMKAGHTGLSQQVSVLERKLDEKNLRLLYLESIQNRPQRFDGIDEWVSSRFSNAIILLPRALKELKAIQPKDYNLSLLCDCLEYLGSEYYALLQGLISQEELSKHCSIKYNRLFTVTPNKSGIKGEYSEQYQVNWHGKARDLDLHLKVGNTAPFLIRIYFFYDTEEKRIFIGSLPGHLDT